MSNENPKPEGGEPQGPWDDSSAEQAFFKGGENMGQAPADQAAIEEAGWDDVLSPAPAAPKVPQPAKTVSAPPAVAPAQTAAPAAVPVAASKAESVPAAPAPAPATPKAPAPAPSPSVQVVSDVEEVEANPVAAPARSVRTGGAPVRDEKGGISGGAAGVSEDGRTTEWRVPKDDERPRGVLRVTQRGGVAGEMNIGGSRPAGVGSSSSVVGDWDDSLPSTPVPPRPTSRGGATRRMHIDLPGASESSASAVPQRPASADYGQGRIRWNVEKMEPVEDRPAVDESVDDEQPVQGTRRITKARVAAAIVLLAAAGVGYEYLMRQRPAAPAPDGSFETDCSLFAKDARGNVQVACEGTQGAWDFSPRPEQVRGEIRADVELAKDGVLNLCKPEFQRPKPEQLRGTSVVKPFATVRGMCRPVGGKR